MHRSIQRATSVPANPMLLEGALHRVGEMDNDEIRARIRKLLDADELPCEEPQKTWAGSGGGKHCAACGHAILPTEVRQGRQPPGRRRHGLPEGLPRDAHRWVRCVLPEAA